jgi:hypothetical protein
MWRQGNGFAAPLHHAGSDFFDLHAVRQSKGCRKPTKVKMRGQGQQAGLIVSHKKAQEDTKTDEEAKRSDNLSTV